MNGEKSRVSASIDLAAEGKHAGFLSVPHSRNDSAWGSIRIPITVVRNGAGPGVLLTAGSHGVIPISRASAIDGASSDQKLAAIITPAANPSDKSSSRRWTDLVKKTTDAPRAVTPHVKSVANKACVTGEYPERKASTGTVCQGDLSQSMRN